MKTHTNGQLKYLLTELTGIRQKLFLDRYSMKDKEGNPIETHPEEMWARVAKAVSLVEKTEQKRKYWEGQFFEAMLNFKFSPGGRFLTAAGTGTEATMINCYVIPNPADTRRGIIKTLEYLTEISARGGGVGFNISTLRPSGSYLKAVNGTTSGAVSWAGLYSMAVHDIIQQGGTRRGALMLMMWDWHPDIEEFITVKKTPGKMVGANLSVCVSDAFMEAVKTDSDWDLVFPDTSFEKYRSQWDGDLSEWRRKNYPVKVYRTLKARYLWDLICEYAWASAEPGVVFMDRYNEMNNSWYFEKNIATNPCVTGETLVSTDKGYVEAKNLKVGMKIFTPAGIKEVKKVFNNGKQSIYRVGFSDGGFVKATLDHKFKCVIGKKYQWVKVVDLKKGQKVLVLPSESFAPKKKLPLPAMEYIIRNNIKLSGNYDRTIGFLVGIVLGDGTLRKVQIKNSHSYQCKISFGSRESEWLTKVVDLIESINIHTHSTLAKKSIKKTDGTYVIHSAITLECYKLSTLLIKIGLDPNVKAPFKSVPEEFMKLDREFLSGLLDGLFSTDGSVAKKQDNPMLRFHTSSNVLAQQVRMILLQFGIHARIYKSSRDKDLVYDGRNMYGTGEKYDVIITNEGITRFYSQINLTYQVKQDRIKEIADNWHYIGPSWTASVVSVENTHQEEDVYDVNEPETLTWITNGYVSFDCGEQGLPAWGVCNLSSINLASFVEDEEFNYEAFEKIVKVGIRFLDNAVDSEKYLYKEIEDKQKSERILGLGTMGLADALIKMQIRYGSDEAFGVIDKIFKILRDVSYKTSVEIAKEKGSFPKFNAKKFLEGGFIKTLPENIRGKIKRFGIRNAFLVTEAPTGKISLLSGVSSGIEPVFSFSYSQKDRLGERTMYHPLYQEWLSKNEGGKVPDYFVTADDLTPGEHVKIQALIQKYTDSSISKTVNAPAKHTVNDVKKLYEDAYALGCKGISYMREGSREGTLIRAKEEETVKPGETPLDTRPFVVTGSTYRLETPVGIAFITINETNEKEPLELFINVGKAGSDVQAMAQALGRTISAALRFRSHINPTERAREIAMQLAGIGGRRSVGFGPKKVLSLPDAVACAISMHFDFRVNGFFDKSSLQSKKAEVNSDSHQETGNGHTKNIEVIVSETKEEGGPLVLFKEEHPKAGDICPSCGSSSLVFEEGCSKCYSCGHSEC